MKQLTLILAFIAISFSALCQSKSYAHHIESGRWDSYSKKWILKEPVEINLEFTLNKTNVYINDKAETFLTIIEDEGEKVGQDSYTTHSWACTDEKYRRCTFMMAHNPTTGKQVYIIMYNDVIFRYYISSSSNDNFN